MHAVLSILRDVLMISARSVEVLHKRLCNQTISFLRITGGRQIDLVTFQFRTCTINYFHLWLWQCNELIFFGLVESMAKKTAAAAKAAKKVKAAQKVEKKETKKVLKTKGAAPNNGTKGKSKAKKANDSDTDDDDLEGILEKVPWSNTNDDSRD